MAVLKRNKRYLIFISIIYIFVLQLGIEQRITIFKYWDECYAFLYLPLALLNFNGKIKIKKENKDIRCLSIVLVLFVSIGIVSNCVFRYQVAAAVLWDIFLNLKFFMGIGTTYYLFRNFKIEKYKNGIRFHAKMLIALFFILVLQNKITHFGAIGDRFGLSSEKIFFAHPTELAAVAFFLLLLLMISTTRIKTDRLFIGMALLVILSTLRFKAFGAVIMFVYIYHLSRLGIQITVRHLLPLILFIIIVGGPQLYFYFFSTETMDMARGALTLTSVVIAIDTFPLGAGFGTFASWASGIYYSPLYQLYGISEVWGLAIDDPQFISDTFWPMIIAQNGFIGTILYLIIVYYLFRLVAKCFKIDKFLYVSGMGALFYLLISSTAEPAFVNPIALPLAFVVGLCICSCKQHEKSIVI